MAVEGSAVGDLGWAASSWRSLGYLPQAPQVAVAGSREPTTTFQLPSIAGYLESMPGRRLGCCWLSSWTGQSGNAQTTGHRETTIKGRCSADSIQAPRGCRLSSPRQPL
ncbi:hypothetical protein WJX73_009148 [Symbiochloris irregularis]|uniref:Uncharacterized protein n=1 Tax=Symbiochloris irregularis TaxID=706552 RepID=A0AAW1NPG1_9CHLO